MRRVIFLAATMGVAVALLVAVAAVRQGSVGAQPIAGATYTGTVSGDGSIEFTVSDDGASIEELTIASEDCGPFHHDPSSPFDPWPVARGIPIVDDEFTFEQSSWSFAIASPSCTLACSGLSFSFTGSFPSPGNAKGSFSFGSAPSPCNFGKSTWTATTAVPSPTPTPTPTPTRAVSIAAHSWANFAWTGDTSAQDVVDCFDEDSIAVMYRLDAETQFFDRWIRGREELSTMDEVQRYDVLLALNASDQPATCDMADPSPVSPRTLTIPAHGWANFAWTGETISAQELANCYNDENIAVMYRLDAETQVFQRWIHGREGLSNMGDIAQFDVLLALNASDQLATCTMNGG